MKKLLWYWKVAACVVARRYVSPASISEDYDRLSRTYDDVFSTHVRRHSEELVRRMGLASGARVLDVACGTGTLSLAAAREVGAGGLVTGVDGSAGMLRAAERKRVAANLENVRFGRGDMTRALAACAEGSLDAVTCGWAIGYAHPPEMVGLMARCLKSGGLVGIIENRRDTLLPIRQTAIRVCQALPQHFRRIMDLHTRLPEDAESLNRLFAKAGLCPVDSWNGEIRFSFGSGEEVLGWVLRTGASAGFDRVMDKRAQAECDELFIRFIERDFLRDGKIVVAHRFAAAIGKKA